VRLLAVAVAGRGLVDPTEPGFVRKPPINVNGRNTYASYIKNETHVETMQSAANVGQFFLCCIMLDNAATASDRPRSSIAIKTDRTSENEVIAPFLRSGCRRHALH